MSKVDFNDFTWFIPKPKSRSAITIPNLNIMNLNAKLMENMPSYVTIGVDKTGKCLCLREQAPSGYKLPRSGSVKDKELIANIVALGVRLPARYAVWQENGYWLAILDAHFSPKVNMSNPPKNPRKRDLKGLLEEGGRL